MLLALSSIKHCTPPPRPYRARHSVLRPRYSHYFRADLHASNHCMHTSYTIVPRTYLHTPRLFVSSKCSKYAMIRRATMQYFQQISNDATTKKQQQQQQQTLITDVSPGRSGKRTPRGAAARGQRRLVCPSRWPSWPTSATPGASSPPSAARASASAAAAPPETWTVPPTSGCSRAETDACFSRRNGTCYNSYNSSVMILRVSRVAPPTIS